MNKIEKALAELLKVFPTDGEMFEAGWELSRIDQACAAYDRARSALSGYQPTEGETPSVEAAHEMGAKGGPVVEAERLAFEAWMRGHCWALSATWNGSQYVSDAEGSNYVCPRAMRTRQLWAAWRDRAALAPPPPMGGERDAPQPADVLIRAVDGSGNTWSRAEIEELAANLEAIASAAVMDGAKMPKDQAAADRSWCRHQATFAALALRSLAAAPQEGGVL